jgi:acetyl esterase/lipase
MAQLQEKKQTKHKGLKIFSIVIAIIIAIVLVGIVVINMMVKPVSDKSENPIYVGAMLTSDTIDYSTDSADGLKNNLIIKIMQVVWKNCQSSDAKVHESQTPPTDIVKHKDIAYIDDGNMYHMLDVYYPENTNEPLPVIIDIHGGGWMYATKDLNEYYCLALAERGYVVFNISYRLVPDVTVNEQLQDVAEALKWISENTSNYPCDTSSIMLTGDSAGGQLAIYSAIIMQSPELQEIFGTVDIDMDITKLLLTSPVSYMRNGGLFSIYTKPLWGKDYKNKSTYDYMDLDKIIDYVDTMPPVYLITSSGDFLAHTQTVKAYELLKSKGFTAELADYDKKEFNQSLQHVFSVLDPFDEAGKTAIDNALEYLNNAQ